MEAGSTKTILTNLYTVQCVNPSSCAGCWGQHGRGTRRGTELLSLCHWPPSTLPVTEIPRISSLVCPLSASWNVCLTPKEHIVLHLCGFACVVASTWSAFPTCLVASLQSKPAWISVLGLLVTLATCPNHLIIFIWRTGMIIVVPKSEDCYKD